MSAPLKDHLGFKDHQVGTKEGSMNLFTPFNSPAFCGIIDFNQLNNEGKLL